MQTEQRSACSDSIALTIGIAAHWARHCLIRHCTSRVGKQVAVEFAAFLVECKVKGPKEALRLQKALCQTEVVGAHRPASQKCALHAGSQDVTA